MIKSVIRNVINSADGLFGLRALMREGNSSHPLRGDRAIEWSWVVSHLPEQNCRILDIGCVESVLTGIAARLGHTVTAVDLRDIEYEMPGVTFYKKNIIESDFKEASFDVIMNCSVIEHVGLPDRYGSTDFQDGDFTAMEKMSRMLSKDGKMILTIPVGIDGEFLPFHRIYGEKRLPLLLAHYNISAEEYWHKAQDERWVLCDKQTALNTQGSSEVYALGLFVLEGDKK